MRAAAPGDSQHTARPLLPCTKGHIVTMDTRSLSWQACISIAIHQFLCFVTDTSPARKINDLRVEYSPVNPPLTSPTLLRQAVRAFVSNNDLKKSYGEHESIHALYSS